MEFCLWYLKNQKLHLNKFNSNFYFLLATLHSLWTLFIRLYHRNSACKNSWQHGLWIIQTLFLETDSWKPWLDNLIGKRENVFLSTIKLQFQSFHWRIALIEKYHQGQSATVRWILTLKLHMLFPVCDVYVTGGSGGRMQEGENEKSREEGGRLTSGRHNENLLRFWSKVLRLCVSLVSVCAYVCVSVCLLRAWLSQVLIKPSTPLTINI